MNKFWFEPRTIVAYAVSLLALAEIVDLTIVGVAVPHIMGSLSANLTEVSTTITSYIVAAAVCIPLTGLFVRKFGMKNVVLVSTLLFGISSVLCGIATSVTEMIIFRIIQGIGGAFLPSIAQSYISQNFTQEEQPKIMTVYSLCVVMGPIIGPIFGGVLAEQLTWRWCFYVNIPLCAAGFALVYFFMPKQKTDNVKIDVTSFLFMALGIGFLEYFIDEGNTNNWFDSFSMIVIFLIAIILIGFFIWRSILGKSVIRIEIFKNMNFTLSCLSMFIFMILIVMSLAYYPTLLQQSYGYPADTAGIITAPRGMIAFIAAPIIAKLISKFDARKILFGGLLIFAYSSFMLSGYAPATSQTMILLSAMVQGVGMMAFFIPIMQIVFIDIPHDLHGDASGMFNFFRNFASSIGTSISATIVSHQQQVSYHDLASNVSPYSEGFKMWSQNLSTMPENAQVIAAHGLVMQQSAIISYLDSFYITGIAMLIFCWLPFLLKRPAKGAKVHID